MSAINLISDTVTRPSVPMLEAMHKAEVGDDVFGQDPTVNALEAKAAALFGKEAALFCPSGTMTNQIAIKVHTNPLDEVICEEYSHIYQYETGGYAFNSGVAINLIKGENGKFTAEQLATVIKPHFDWLPTSRLVVLENTCNKGGGSYYNLEEINSIKGVCEQHGLTFHLDGARLFNALVETEESTLDYGAVFDTISICLSKGLGAPVGSLLIGSETHIKKARRIRKVMGGGMRQAGYLAAAGIYALDNNIERLKEDNAHAKRLGKVLEQLDWVAGVRPVRSNIVIFDVKAPLDAAIVLAKMEQHSLKAVAFGPQTIRFVTHLDVTAEMIEKAVKIIESLAFG